jgi:hypothetical protein
MKNKLRILMKNEVLTLIIGIFLGAIITTTIFLIMKGNDKNSMPNMDNMPMNEKTNEDNNFKSDKFNTDNKEQDKESDSDETESDTE